MVRVCSEECMEEPIAISKINDFIFCPASIYFHQLDESTEKMLYQSSYQLNGSSVHESIDKNNYSDKKSILQGIEVYCDKYNIYGKIDIFNEEKGILTERKNQITTIYDGYIFQLYAEYFSLLEMGYKVNEIRLYSYKTNTLFSIKKPEDNYEMLIKFEETLVAMEHFNILGFKSNNEKKCGKCIYEDLCSYSTLK